MSEYIECINCGWEGKDVECHIAGECPQCKCSGYLDVSEIEYLEEEDRDGWS